MIVCFLIAVLICWHCCLLEVKYAKGFSVGFQQHNINVSDDIHLPYLGFCCSFING